MLNLERIRMLHAISQHGSVSSASKALHVTTAAVSQQITKLEREVGQPLIARNGRGIRLTDAGNLLANHASDILSNIEQAEADLDAHLGKVTGQLVISAFPSAARGLLPGTLTALRATHPQLHVQLQEMEADTMLPALHRSDLDLAIVLDWDNKPMGIPEGLTTTKLIEDQAGLAVPINHRLANRQQVSLTEVADDHWITWPRGETCQEWLMYTLRSNGFEPHIAHTAGEHQTQLSLVAAGLGVAIIPRIGRGPIPPGVAIVPVSDTLRRHIHAMWRHDSHRRPSIQAAITALKKVANTSTAVPAPI